jgi:hypothetical protein
MLSLKDDPLSLHAFGWTQLLNSIANNSMTWNGLVFKLRLKSEDHSPECECGLASPRNAIARSEPNVWK